jgi:hypothetical protein
MAGANLVEYEGHIFMEVNGQEIEVISLDEADSVGRKPVQTMKRSRRIAGFTRLIRTFDLKLTVAIPITGEIDWASIEGAKITKVSPDGSKRVSYLGCFVTGVGDKHSVNNEAARDISVTAVDRVNE